MNWPGEMGGSHPLATWLNKLLRAAKASALTPGVGYQVKRTSNATVLEIHPGGGGGTTTSSGMVFRGGWSDVEEYNSQEVVFRTPPGGSSGAYIALSDSIPVGTLPEAGSPYWAEWPYPPAGMWG